MAKQLVKLRTKPSRDGKRFTYVLDYMNEHGKRTRISLGHADRQKAERQRAQRQRELTMGCVIVEHMRLSELLADSLERTRGQVRECTLLERDTAMRHFIEAVGDIDVQTVKHRHGETFIQACLDKANSPATANKKIGCLRRLFQLAVVRGQLDENPFRYVRHIKVPARKVRVYNDQECTRLLNAASVPSRIDSPDWALLVVIALCTAMRRGELLNTTWADIDFDRLMISVSPKQNTTHTWEWRIKDSERRTLPLTNEVVELLRARRTGQTKLHPYVFISPGPVRVHSEAPGAGEMDRTSWSVSGEQLRPRVPHAPGAGRDRTRRIPRPAADMPEPLARQWADGVRRDAARRPQRIFDHPSVLSGGPDRPDRPGENRDSGRDGR